jgi:hypothetical protein
MKTLYFKKIIYTLSLGIYSPNCLNSKYSKNKYMMNQLNNLTPLLIIKVKKQQQEMKSYTKEIKDEIINMEISIKRKN